jgi:hypothetical protein
MSIDKEKKKYFKIQPNGGGPVSSAYSSQDVKRRKTRDERAEARALGIARQRGRIKRSKMMANSFAGGLLSRESGHGSLDNAQVLAEGLVPQGYISSMMQFSACSSPLFAFGHRPDLGPSISDLWIGKSPSLTKRHSTEFPASSNPFVYRLEHPLSLYQR